MLFWCGDVVNDNKVIPGCDDLKLYGLRCLCFSRLQLVLTYTYTTPATPTSYNLLYLLIFKRLSTLNADAASSRKQFSQSGWGSSESVTQRKVKCWGQVWMVDVEIMGLTTCCGEHVSSTFFRWCETSRKDAIGVFLCEPESFWVFQLQNVDFKAF